MIQNSNLEEMYASGIVAAAFVEVGMELEFVSKELARDVELFTADYDDVLAIEDLLCDNGGESTCECQHNGNGVEERMCTQEVTLAVDDNGFLKGSHLRLTDGGDGVEFPEGRGGGVGGGGGGDVPLWTVTDYTRRNCNSDVNSHVPCPETG